MTTRTLEVGHLLRLSRTIISTVARVIAVSDTRALLEHQALDGLVFRRDLPRTLPAEQPDWEAWEGGAVVTWRTPRGWRGSFNVHRNIR